MISIRRVKTIMLYSWFHLNHSLETWADLLWMPVMEVLVFGFLSGFLQTSTNDVSVMILFGLLLWQGLKVVQYGLSIGMMWDIWSRSFSSLFVSPLSMQEFVIGHILAGVIKALFVIAVLSVPVYFMIGTTLLSLGINLLVYMAILFTFAAAVGIFTNSLIIRFGTSIQSFAWSLIYVLWPISAILYPVSILPTSIQPVAYLSPITYVMETMREQLASGATNWTALGYATVMTIGYLIAAILFFRFMLHRSQQSGAFARMEG